MVTSGALADIRERYETFHSKNWQQDIGAAYLAASYKLLKQDKQADKLFDQQVWRNLEQSWSSLRPELTTRWCTTPSTCACWPSTSPPSWTRCR